MGEPTVTDALTGLEWQLKNTTIQNFTYDDAIAHCAALNYGEHTGDWRAPSRIELWMLVDHANGVMPENFVALCLILGAGLWAAHPSRSDATDGRLTRNATTGVDITDAVTGLVWPGLDSQDAATFPTRSCPTMDM